MTASTATKSRSLIFLLSSPAIEPRLRQAFIGSGLASLRVALIAKLIAALLVAVFLVAQYPQWPILYWLAICGVFAAAGILQYRLTKRRALAWHKYAFMSFDIVLLAIALIVRNPFIDYGGLPVQMDLRHDMFLYFFVLLALSAFSYSPRFVLFTGAFSALVWSVAVLPIVLRPDTITLLDMPNYAAATIAEKARYTLEANFVNLANLVTHAVIVLVVALMLAFAASRQLRLVVRQIGAERSRAALSRYFSPNMVDEIATLERPLGEVRSQNAGVLFADLVGFTGHSERLGPAGTMDLLRGFHRRMAETVFAHEGTVDKYIGDAVMATFGTPRPAADDALRAIRCALGMIEAIAGWNVDRAAAGEAPVRIGIGLHYGAVVTGDMGDERRLEYAVIGDTVNVASRVEHLTRELGVEAVITGDVVAAAKTIAGADAVLGTLRQAGTVSVRGRAEPVTLFVADARSPGMVTGGAKEAAPAA